MPAKKAILRKPPPDAVPRKKKTPPPELHKGSDGKWRPSTPMPGPNAPDPKFPATLGKDPSNGQYRVPGLGEWGKRQNIEKNRETNAFNPGLDQTRKTSLGHNLSALVADWLKRKR